MTRGEAGGTGAVLPRPPVELHEQQRGGFPHRSKEINIGVQVLHARAGSVCVGAAPELISGVPVRWPLASLTHFLKRKERGRPQ